MIGVKEGWLTKHMKKIVITVVLVSLVVGYYFYLSNRDINTEKNNSETSDVSKLISRNLDGEYYPEFPRDVVSFYSKIVQAYYYTELSEKEIEGLGSQARKLFDAELLEKNPENQFFENLKNDISEYNEAERKIYGFTVENANDVDIFSFQGESYARVRAAYIMREKGSAATVYEDYTLRKDEDGKWKILYWEVAVPSEEDNE